MARGLCTLGRRRPIAGIGFALALGSAIGFALALALALAIACPAYPATLPTGRRRFVAPSTSMGATAAAQGAPKLGQVSQ